MRFAGQHYDTETGLNYNYFRDYDPQVGRYIESDPIGLDGGINTYSYGDSDPVSFVDALGLMIDYGGYVISNPLVRTNFDLLASLIVQSGIADDCFVLRVTGGDRYRDPTNPSLIRSATNNAVVPNADPHSPHLVERGARAIDFVIQNNAKQCNCKPVTDALVDQLLMSTDFSAANTRRNYPEGPHTHINLPNLPKYYVSH